MQFCGWPRSGWGGSDRSRSSGQLKKRTELELAPLLGHRQRKRIQIRLCASIELSTAESWASGWPLCLLRRWTQKKCPMSLMVTQRRMASQCHFSGCFWSSGRRQKPRATMRDSASVARGGVNAARRSSNLFWSRRESRRRFTIAYSLVERAFFVLNHGHG